MCNCILLNCSNRESCGPGNSGEIVYIGLVTYANVCKDIIEDIQKSFGNSRTIQFQGCYGQDNVTVVGSWNNGGKS